MDQRLKTRDRCIDALDRIDQKASKEVTNANVWEYTGDVETVRYSVEALMWVLQNTTVSADKLEVFVSSMCEAYGVEGP